MIKRLKKPTNKDKKTHVALVTGGAGFIGSHVADHLIKRGIKTVVLDDLSGGFLTNVPKKAIFIKGSVTDPKILDSIFQRFYVDYVYHLAAYAAEGLSHFIRRFNYENNLIGSINLINRAVKNKVKHFVFTSSIAVYGSGKTPLREDMAPSPEDPYGISKYAVELDIMAAHQMFGLNYTIFRPHNVYGEKQNHGDPYRNVLGIFINRIMKDQPLTIFGNGLQKRAFSYIGDVAPYIANAPFVAKARNEIFNIGADNPTTVVQMAKIISKAMGVKPQITFLPKRKEVFIAFSDHSKVKKAFKTKPSTPLGQGIKKMVAWAKKRGPIEGKKFEFIEVEDNMPPSWRELFK